MDFYSNIPRPLFLDQAKRRRRQALALLLVVLGTLSAVAVLFFGAGYLLGPNI